MSRKAGSDEFKRELSRAEKNRRFRESLLTDPEARAKRLEGIEGIEGLDELLVSQALQGGTFGKKDRARYDALLKEQEGNTEETETSLPPQGGGGQATGNVSGGENSIVSPISQDNDIAIAGDSNSVNQDNSITQTIDTRDQYDNRRYYGGSNRVFNYGGAEDGGLGMSKRFLDKFINKSVINNSNVVDFSDSQIGSFNPGKNPIRDMKIFGN